VAHICVALFDAKLGSDEILVGASARALQNSEFNFGQDRYNAEKHRKAHLSMNRFRTLIPILGLMVLLTCLNSDAYSQSRNQLEDENLIVALPHGFMVGANSSHDGMETQEWVRLSEKIDNWSELITVQIFYGKHYEPAQFIRDIGGHWLTACPGSKPNTINNGEANGYKVSMVLLQCSLNPVSNKPETTLFRAIKGNDSFYIVQWAIRFDASQEKIANMAKFLGTVNVCDTRTNGHPCPETKAQQLKQ
jgi:hypothetical protein